MAHSVYEGFISSFEDDTLGSQSNPQTLFVEQESLDLGYELRKRNIQVHNNRGVGSFAQVPLSMKPKGTIVFAFRADDSLRFLNAHFQYGTSSVTGTATTYTFHPHLGEGRYSRYDIIEDDGIPDTFCPFTISIEKVLWGTGTNSYLFRQGIVESLTTRAGVGLEASFSAGVRFLSATAQSAVQGSVGAYSVSSAFESFNANIKVDGAVIDLVGFEANSWQKLQDITPLGKMSPNGFKFLDYQLTGNLMMDLPNDAFKHVGSMIGTKNFSLTATMTNTGNDKFIISLPVCRRLPFNFNQGTGDSKLTASIPFESYSYGTDLITYSVITATTSSILTGQIMLDAHEGARGTGYATFNAQAGARTIATFLRFDRDV